MCGIAGILSTQLEKTPMAAALLAMQQSLSHRGPDGDGIYLSPLKQAALAHTRLAIIDLSETGSQPMSSADGRYTISFNGEIYNYRILRDELARDGIQFASQSDTEVILHLYSLLGSACVSKLRGMFAFVIWDEQQQTAFAARDPFGIKPLYYWHNQQSLALASEVRAIIASNLSSQMPCPSGLKSYFERGTIAEPNTIINDIKMLPAGHALTWKDGDTTLSCHAKLVFNQQNMSREKAVEITRAALKDSVKAHMVSDVPVGIFLSGGIDSTALVALATQISEKQVRTYSIAFTDPQWNEGDIAKRVASHFGTKHTEFLMTPEKARPLFEQYLSIIDQPTIDGFNTFCVSHFASSLGEKVVLSGLGGDELFAGYKSFSLLPKMTRLSRVITLLAPLIRFKARLFNRILSARGRRILDFLSKPGSLVAAHQSLRGVFSNSESAWLTRQYQRHEEVAQVTTKHLDAPNPDQTQRKSALADRISHLELTSYLRNQLLRDSDVTSMACGLELRVPFIDKAMFDQVASIPSTWRLEPNKKLLIDSVPEIPEWIISRPKQGFRFPFDEWFSDAWQSVKPSLGVGAAHENLENVDLTRGQPLPSWIKLKPWYRHWSLVVLDDWLSRYTEQHHSKDRS